MEQTEQRRDIADWLTTGPLRVAVSLVVPVIAFLVLRWSFIFMRDSEASKFLIGLVALIVGVLGVWLIYYATNELVSLLPENIRERVRPYVFVGPAMVVLAIYVVFPAVNTLYFSFLDAKSDNFVGLENYVFGWGWSSP
jgi:alpha-glucoside transport system permease protein